MAYRARDIYKGHRKRRMWLIVPLTILLVAAALFLFLFFYLQRYLVYDQSGVTLQIALLHPENEQTEEVESAAVTASDEPIDVEIVYENTDFSVVDYGTHDDLAVTHSLFVPYESVTDLSAVSAAITQAVDGGYTGLVLQMKDRSGVLAWNSSCETAQAYASGGTMDFTDILAQIHESGLTAAAQISCCTDALLTERNWTVTLKSADGSTWHDDDGVSWLDPYNHTVRGYVCELVEELSAMGFDEIILADIIHPVSDEGFTYTVTLQLEADPVTAVCQLAQQAVQAVPDESTTVVSALIDSGSLHNDLGSRTGQDLSVFWRLFARLYCPCESGSTAADTETAWSYANGGTAAARFVPVVSSAPESSSSYCVRAQG